MRRCAAARTMARAAAAMAAMAASVVLAVGTAAGPAHAAVGAAPKPGHRPAPHKPAPHKPAPHKPSPGQQLVTWLNAQRTAHHLARLTVSADLTAVAHDHTAHMARRGTVFHNAYVGAQVHGWQRLGEDVAGGRSLAAIERGLLAGSDRVDLLGPAFRQVGVGVAQRGRLLYVTVLVRQPLPARHR